MPEFEFDVDASIAAGWERFAARLAALLRDLVPGATFDLAVPVPGTRPGKSPYIRFTAAGLLDDGATAGTAGDGGATPDAVPGMITAEVAGGGTDDDPAPLRAGQYDQLTGLGWDPPRAGVPVDQPRLRVPTEESTHLAHLVAGTMERVFGIPHPVFLHDVTDTRDAPVGDGGKHDGRSESDAVDFRPQPITDPDQATRAVGIALSEVYGGSVEADEHDVFTVPAGCVVLFIRAHRSMPLIVFRSPLVHAVEDAAAAETEVAILNRDSMWCRYVFDGKAVYAESEFVDRVFVPVNFKIQLAEISAELDDVYPDLARRVAAEQWRDLHSADDPRSGEQ